MRLDTLEEGCEPVAMEFVGLVTLIVLVYMIIGVLRDEFDI